MDNAICLSGIVVGVICAFIGGSINSSKGRSYEEGFAYGFLLGIIGLIIVAVLPKNEKALEESKLKDGTGKKCPYCAEIIKSEALICKHCHRELPDIEILNLAIAHNLKVTDFQKDENEAKLVIKDMTYLDPDQRKIHAVEFIEVLWRYTKASIITVEYLQQDGIPYFRTRANADLFARIEKENLSTLIIADEAEMIDLKNNHVIPKTSN